ncbi:MAG: hypothetical protein ACYTGC_17365 [Planctomycetota bacterium]|jgi:hypothetical protein
METSEMPLVCHRCGASLTPGEGSFYVVRIEAWADPTPPRVPDEAVSDAGDLQRLIDSAAELSEQELMDQVYRRLTMYMCWPCYRDWIEKPAG